ncbi:zinc-type alcohol dehydrogenase-like protein [Elysia marginata]|uniref:Zinc-type alcohol dehydrogenase-like protein n=1 Tax=Elysia marginata TaxID=1093978 RepID=A0AAV4EMH6_9GAST|nr:zinc-type alcohol dehydrogenase-like protein [Elysia marginata]
MPKPKPSGRELLVNISAVSIDPVDYKIRQIYAKDKSKILGWDVVGIVEETGSEVGLFEKGDRIFYPGDITHSDTNTEYQLIDERIVGRAPKNLDDVQLAAIPLIALTASEILFDRMRLSKQADQNKTILIIGGARALASIVIQLAKKVLDATIIATASGKEAIKWCKNIGVDHVVDHKDLVNEVRNLGFQDVDYILDFVDTNFYWNAMIELIKSQGHIASISTSRAPIVLNGLKNKSATFSWELMSNRSISKSDDMIEQHYMLNKTADLFESEELKPIIKKILEGFTVDNFKKAHSLLESGKTIGKIVIKH